MLVDQGEDPWRALRNINVLIPRRPGHGWLARRVLQLTRVDRSTREKLGSEWETAAGGSYSLAALVACDVAVRHQCESCDLDSIERVLAASRASDDPFALAPSP